MRFDGDRSPLPWRPRRCADVQLANLDDETVLYHPDRMTALALNTTASLILELCDGERTLIEIVDLLRREYPEASSGMAREVEESVLTFLDHGILRAPRVGPSAAVYDVGFGGTAVRLEADNPSCATILDFLCADMRPTSPGTASATFRLGPATSTGAIAAYRDDLMLYWNQSESLVAEIFLERVLDYLVRSCSRGMLLHAAAVARDGRALILAGKTGAGKTTLTTWLVHSGLDYLTEELVWIDTGATSLQGFGRPLYVKEAGRPLFETIIDMDAAAVMKASLGYQISPSRRHQYEGFGEEVKHQLRRYGRVFKREIGSFGREAAHQLGTGWGEEFARQIFGPPRRRRRRG